MSRQAWVFVVSLLAGLVTHVLRADEAVPRRWLAHDMQRPRPAVVTPGRVALPVPPPSDAVVVFGGTDLANWRDAAGGPAKWRVREDYMESVPNSGYIHTAQAFGDIQLHVEWAAPTPASGRGQGRGNSGVFLMGLYEVQVLDSYENETYADGQAGAIYGQYPPLVNACRPPGQWQSYDLVFRRPRFDAQGALLRPARITLIHNGVLVQDNAPLWGPTTWLQNRPYEQHPDKLPIALQDHGNPVRFRNVWLRELAESDPPTTAAERQDEFVDLPADDLQKFVGNYGSILGELGSIKLHDRQLRVHMKTGQVIDLLPRSQTDFALRYTAGEITFNVDESGKVSGFSMQLGGERYPVRRLGASP